MQSVYLFSQWGKIGVAQLFHFSSTNPCTLIMFLLYLCPCSQLSPVCLLSFLLIRCLLGC